MVLNSGFLKVSNDVGNARSNMDKMRKVLGDCLGCVFDPNLAEEASGIICNCDTECDGKSCYKGIRITKNRVV